jgi:hypothetical protein
MFRININLNFRVKILILAALFPMHFVLASEFLIKAMSQEKSEDSDIYYLSSPNLTGTCFYKSSKYSCSKIILSFDDLNSIDEDGEIDNNVRDLFKNELKIKKSETLVLEDLSGDWGELNGTLRIPHLNYSKKIKLKYAPISQTKIDIAFQFELSKIASLSKNTLIDEIGVVMSLPCER